MKAVVSLLLTAASRLKMSTEGSDDLKVTVNEEIAKAIKGLYPSFEKWVKDKLSGEVFGGSRTYFHEFSSKAELKVIYYAVLIFL